MKKSNKKSARPVFLRIAAVLLSLCLLAVPVAAEEESVTDDNGWVSFFLMCNEGMNNRGGNAGNTMMVVSMNELTGKIRLMMFTWDTFVEYEGYDMPQKIDMAYRNNGPEEAVKVFNANFGTDIEMYLSLNYLNLATLIDDYGGVNVDVSRAERNALNGMVDSKKEYLKQMQDANLLDQLFVELLAKEYYLEDFGPDTHLNGLQAVAFGWLQYDSVYNCCQRDVEVIASLFNSVGEVLGEEVVFYENGAEKPDVDDSHRVINLDDVSEEELQFMREAISPIFETSYNNLPEEDIESITMALARVSYEASRQGVNILDQMETAIFPLEATQPYEIVAGAEGHVIDYEKNAEKMKEYLYAE